MRLFVTVTVVVLAGCASGRRPPAPTAPTAPTAPRVDAPASQDTPAPSALPAASAAPPASASASPAPDKPQEARPTPAETRECAARGGTIQPVCMLGELACVIRYRDGGKQCRDKSDCVGECLYEGPDPPPPNAAGRCQRTSDPCGCKALVHRGHVEATLCAD